MGNLIQLLPDHIANQIAAGEVIQRPASVVKELMENAIDAGAEKIEVHIKDAGKTLIQVLDNGKGMNRTDAEMCFARHATSKIRTAADLFDLHTKGFRGEALASIAAIAHVALQTRQPESETGHCIIMEGSELRSVEETVCPAGSSFEIKNLFFNVPARRNFLKSNDVEFRHIRDEFERIVLAHPAIQFVLTHNGQDVYRLQNAVLRKRIVDVIGDRQNERLVPIEENTDIVSLKGYVIKPEYAKKSRGEQFFFVNDRYFKDHYFNHAINKAFDGLIQPKTFPGYFLYFTVDPSKIDVNVHPTKTEIKFEEDRLIYAILVSSIRQALGKYNVAPTLDFERETSFDLPASMKSQPAVEPQIKVDPDYNPFKTSASSGSSSTSSRKDTHSTSIQRQGFGSTAAKQEDWENFYAVDALPDSDTDAPGQTAMEEVVEIAEHVDQYIYRSPYIITPKKNGLMLIHARRAYERIVYDAMIGEFITHPIASQTLLFPFEREVSANEASLWQEHTTILTRLGFAGVVEENQLQLNAIPAVLQEESIGECLDAIFRTVAFSTIEKGDIAHILIGSIAKNAGRRKGLITGRESVQSLIEQLFQCPEHVYTPDGRTILQSMSLEEIEQKF